MLLNYQVHKAAGPDEIPARLLLKETSDLLAPSLTHIYQASFHQCADWKQAYIVPIFTEGNHAAPN